MICLVTYEPRPYQTECISALTNARANGIDRGLVVMASGLGKTLTAAFDIKQFLQEHLNARILVLCHQENILLQTKRKFQQYFGEEYSYGMYSGSYKVARRADFTFATFQSMYRHRTEFANDTFDYIVVDEAHHTSATTYRPTVDYFQTQFLLGLTATKDRMDGQSILDTYCYQLFSMDIFEGWQQGYLARVEYNLMLNDLDEATFRQYLQPQDTNVKLTIDQLNKTFCCVQTDADLVASIRKETSDLVDPTIFIFCNSITQAESLIHHFGGEAATVHSKQSPQQNQAILDAFYAGDIKIILSVNMLNEGIDIPAADVVVFLRATDSQTVFFQQLGRGARITEGKRTLRVLDYVANAERLMMVLEMEARANTTGGAGDTRVPPIEVKIPKVKFTVRKIDIEKILEILQSKGRGSFDSEVEFFAAARAYAAELGHPDHLSIADIDNNRNFPCWETLRKTYVTMENFLTLAGLTPRRKARKRFTTKKAIREALSSKILQKRGKSPTKRELAEDYDMPTMYDILALYPSYNDALLDAGATKLNSVKGATKMFPDADMCQEAQKMAQNLGRCPTTSEWDNNPSTCSVSVLEKRHGSFNKAMESYGLKPNARHKAIRSGNKRRGIVDGAIAPELRQKLQDLVRKTGRKIKGSDLTLKNGLPAPNYFYEHGYNITKINQCIEAEKIILESAVFTPIDDEAKQKFKLIVRRERRPLMWSDVSGAKKEGMLSPTYFRKRNINTIDLVNAIVGTDQILTEIESENN